MPSYTYDYFIYGKDDVSNERLNKARSSFNYTGQDMYVITRDGEISIVQSENTRPHTNCTMDEAAQLHIKDMQDADAAAEKEQSTMEEMQENITNLQDTKADKTDVEAMKETMVGQSDIDAIWDSMAESYNEGVNNA